MKKLLWALPVVVTLASQGPSTNAMPSVDVRIPAKTTSIGPIEGFEGATITSSSTDGSRLLAVMSNHHYVLVSVPEAKIVETFDATWKGDVTDARLSPDLRYAAFLSNGKLSLASVSTGKTAHSFDDSTTTAVAFSRDGKYLVVATSTGDEDSPSNVVTVWRTGDWTKAAEIPMSTDGVAAVDISSDSTRLMVLATDKVYVYSVVLSESGDESAKSKLIWTSPAIENNVVGAAISPDGTRVADADGMWDVDSGKKLSDDIDFQSNIFQFTETGALLYTVTSENYTTFYDGKTGAYRGSPDTNGQLGAFSANGAGFYAEDTGYVNVTAYPSEEQIRKTSYHALHPTPRDKASRDLIGALYTCDLAKCRAALARGADPNFVDDQQEAGRSPLEIAVTKGKPAVFDLLVKSGATFRPKDFSSGERLLITACYARNTAIVRHLFEKGVKVDPANAIPLTAVLTRQDGTPFELVRYLVEHGVPTNGVDPETKLRPLDCAVASPGRLQIVKYLVARGAKADNSVLARARLSKDREIIDYVARLNAKP